MADMHYDVVVVGSGAGGILTAIRAHDLGLRTVVIEKTDRYGGTSAVSGGGIWIPSCPWIKDPDIDQKSLEYLRFCTDRQVSDERLNAYIRSSTQMVEYLDELGVHYFIDKNNSYPDYYPDAPGAVPIGRSMYIDTVDGRPLGDDLYNMRESLPEFMLFDRITLSLSEAGILLYRAPGWRLLVLKLLFKYWTDFKGRMTSKRDRRLNIGSALVGGLRKAMISRNIPLLLQTRMDSLIQDDGAVTGITASRLGNTFKINATKAVVLASGGFEQNQVLREKYFPQKTQASWSVTPRDCNMGDGLVAALNVGADTEFLDQAWWAPTMTKSTHESPQVSRSVPVFFERGYPNCLCVNRHGNRFVNEAASYHQFGQAMMKDNEETGGNIPCWFIFDSQFRRKYPVAGILPSTVTPDSALPKGWLDKFIFKAQTLDELAAKMSIDKAALTKTISRFNEQARTGIDKDFGKGDNVYNQFFGDPTVKPNRCLGPVSEGPFYAIKLDLGDIGSKGGPKTDENANVLDVNGKRIRGLYAVGNVAGSVTAGSYPGAGGTLGPAMTFAYVAANHIGQRNT